MVSVTPSPNADDAGRSTRGPAGRLRRLFPRTFQGRLTIAFLVVVTLTLGLATVLVINRLEDYFENQQAVNPQNVKEKAVEFLKDSGIDMAKWNDCYDNKKTVDKVKAQMAEGAALGVTGTPAFFVNGRMLVGAQPFEKFKDIIDDELASAK